MFNDFKKAQLKYFRFFNANYSYWIEFFYLDEVKVPSCQIWQ